MSSQSSFSLALFAVLCLPMGQSNADEGFAVSEEDVNGGPFVVESRVYTGQDDKPVMQTTTVFHGRRAFDRPHGNVANSTKFDFEQQLVSLIDERRQAFAVISFGDMLRFQAELRARAQKRDGLGAFLANPTFVREFDVTSSTIKLSSPWITYEAQGRQSTTDDVERFHEFADWSARLASMVSPSGPPAQARLELNAALKKRNWRVTQVTRRGGPRARHYGLLRSAHEYRDQLNENDLRLMEAVEKNLKEFKEISFSELHALQNSRTAGTKQ